MPYSERRSTGATTDELEEHGFQRRDRGDGRMVAMTLILFIGLHLSKIDLAVDDTNKHFHNNR